MKILFVTGTRADFGKLKPLIEAASLQSDTQVAIAVTGMHMSPHFGQTWMHVEESGFRTFKFENYFSGDTMDVTLSKTILGVSRIIMEWQPTHVVIHGDRVEALAGAIASSLNNLVTVHVEGGELSGTIDESIRHAVTKLSLVHLVSNTESAMRVQKMGEDPNNIHIIGSPELDIMSSDELPEISEVRERYQIPFEKYSVCLYHPVTTQLSELPEKATNVAEALKKSGKNFVIIEPNNDPGHEVIREAFANLVTLPRVRVIPSMRFEHYVSLVKSCDFVIGNSSSGVREAPYLGIPSINLGSRQSGRNSVSRSIFNTEEKVGDIMHSIRLATATKSKRDRLFGDGKSAERFGGLIRRGALDIRKTQKQFFVSD